jgi:hypothetical protein
LNLGKVLRNFAEQFTDNYLTVQFVGN